MFQCKLLYVTNLYAAIGGKQIGMKQPVCVDVLKSVFISPQVSKDLSLSARIRNNFTQA